MVCGTTADCKGALFLHTEEPLKYTQGCWIKGKYVPNYLLKVPNTMLISDIFYPQYQVVKIPWHYKLPLKII